MMINLKISDTLYKTRLDRMKRLGKMKPKD